MRILVTTHYWHPHRGGIETVAHEQSHRLAARGHTVSVLTSRLHDDAPLESHGKLMVHRVASRNFLEPHGVPVPVPTLELWRAARRLVAEADLVLAHGHVYPVTLASLWAARRRTRPIVILQHNPFIRYRLPVRYVEQVADLLIGAHTLRGADSVIAVSKVTAAYVESLSGRRDVDILPNGVDTGRFSPCADVERAALRDRLGLPSEAIVMLTVRRLTFRNGLDTLVEAAARLHSPVRHLIVVVGDGQDRAALEQLAAVRGVKSRVRFVGSVGDEELVDWYRASDLFVLPTRTGEGFGLVLAEAMAAGLATVSTDEGAQREVVRDGETGWLIPAADPDALAHRLAALLDDRDQLRAAGRKGRQAAELMDWERAVDRLEDHLRVVARRHGVDE